MAGNKKFLIIDANSVLHRAYHALPPLKTRTGEIVNAVYGFASIFLRALSEIKPDYVAAAFDVKAPTLRHEEFKEYKAKRPKKADELYQQIPKIKEMLALFGVSAYESPGYEADDLIAALAKRFSRQEIYPKADVVILSGDLDALQLVDEHTKVWTMKKGIKETALYGQPEVRERYGLSPNQMVEMKSLRGDPSDNIPGVTGIGEKGAINLIKEFGTLERLYKELKEKTEKAKDIKPAVKEKLLMYEEQAFFSKKLLTPRDDAPIDFKIKDLEFKAPEKQKIINFFQGLEFFSLLKRAEEIAGSGGKAEPGQAVIFENQIEVFYKQGIFSKEVYELEKALEPIVRAMQETGVKVSQKALKGLSLLLEEKIEAVKSNVFKETGCAFNINSPQQAREILFSRLGVPSKGLRRTPGGAISIDSAELEKIKNLHPAVDLILKYREFFKMKTGFVDNLSQFVSPKDGRIHPHFNQLGAETGRMSCDNPNLQNIPLRGELAGEIRKCFVAETGKTLVSADYSQIEMRIVAFLSEDPKMTKFLSGENDFHLLTASEIFNIPKENIKKEQRNIAKALNFGVLYGMGPRGVMERAPVSFEEARQFIEEYFSDFPEIAEYREKVIEKARETGFVETYFKRKRIIPEINSIDRRLSAQAERIAINAVIQGTAADIIKMAMADLKAKAVLDENCRLILQIHDELIFEVNEAMVLEKAKAIKETMENVFKMEPALRVEISDGPNWRDMRKI